MKLLFLLLLFAVGCSLALQSRETLILNRCTHTATSVRHAIELIADMQELKSHAGIEITMGGK